MQSEKKASVCYSLSSLGCHCGKKNTHKWPWKWQCQVCEARGSGAWQPSNPNTRYGSPCDIYRFQQKDKNFENESRRYWHWCQNYFKNTNGNLPNSCNNVLQFWPFSLETFWIQNHAVKAHSLTHTTQVSSMIVTLILPVRSFLWRHGGAHSWNIDTRETVQEGSMN